jgi:hypothetical protein
MMKNTVLFIGLACLITSCQKSDTPLTVTYGVTYAKNGISALSSIRVFTSSGEIRDAPVLARFSTQDSNYAISTAPTKAANPSGFLDSLYFESQDKAIISNYTQRSRYAVARQGGEQVLTGQDTMTGFIGGTEMSRNMLYFLTTPRITLYDEYIGGVVQGSYYFYYRFQDKVAVRSGGGNTLDVPIILYSWYIGANIAAREFTKGALDPDLHNHIANGDTVTIREFTLHFAKP